MQSAPRKSAEDVAQVGGDQEQAALGPSPGPVSAAQNPMTDPRPNPSAEAQGRRILSTSFVRVGPDGRLTVELRGGRVLVLRDVVMRRKDYCGTLASGGPAARFCGGYAEVTGARPGGASSVPGLANP
jgi:hypothetical protein